MAATELLPQKSRELIDRLELVGREYLDFRTALMLKNNEGLTRIYNRFHDPQGDGINIEGQTPDKVVADVNQLRALHAAMDRAVLDAYGWTDICPTCEFLLENEEMDEDGGGGVGVGRQRKKPWRYRWPDDIRDEVLARLLALNHQRAEEERLAGAAGPKKGRAKRAGGPKNPRKPGMPGDPSTGDLF